MDLRRSRVSGTILGVVIVVVVERMGVEFAPPHESRLFLNSVFVQPTLLDEIKQVHVGNAEIERIKTNISKGKALSFIEDEQGTIRFQNRICVVQKMELEENIMSEADNISIHPGEMKMYRDLR